MFTFDAVENSLYGGTSPDRIPDAMKNRFSMVFGNKALDYRLQVKISERQIRFYYYDHDYEGWDSTVVKDNDYFREVGFITLNRPKDTGNNILDFPQNIGELCLYEQDDNSESKKGLLLQVMERCIKCWGKEYYSFPFICDYEEKDNIHAEDQTFRCFMRCCLLNFIYEFENQSLCFGASPLYDSVHDKLCESDVYKLLSAKIQYTQYLYKDKFFPKNQQKYTFCALKFADYLMDKRLNKVISPDNYGNTTDGQGWFYDPEKELDQIVKKNREHHKQKEVTTLKDSLVSKIRAFFYSKHSVYRAMTSRCSQILFWIAFGLMLFFNVVVIVSLIRFNNTEKSCWNLYENLWVLLLMTLFPIILMGLSGFFAGKNFSGVINAFFPRIIVAEATAWLTIGIADDLLKSMLWVEYKTWLALLLVILLV